MNIQKERQKEEKTPEMKRPMNKVDTGPAAESSAPDMKNALLQSRVMRLPYFSEGELAIMQPIHAPTTVSEVAICASTT